MPGMDGFINFNGTLEGSIAGGGGGDVTDVKVRNSQESTYESVVNEQGVAEIDLISYVRRNELTQAIENIENSIDNVEQLVDTKQNIINCSTIEQNTGIKWVNGKDIYLKVYDLIVPDSSGLYSFPNTETPNLDEVVFSYYSLNKRGMSSYVPWYNNATLLLDDITPSSINMYFQSTYHSGKPLKFILAYTKTEV